MTFLHDPPQQAPRTGGVDWLGIGLLIVGVGSLQYVLEEGNAKDWFDDRVIVRLSIVAAVCLRRRCSGGSSRRATRTRSSTSACCSNRDLAASIFLFVVLGFGLYGGVFIFPLFTQSILGFSPTQTGLAMMPGGLATAAMALVCGRLLNGARPLVDARMLIAHRHGGSSWSRCGTWAT